MFFIKQDFSNFTILHITKSNNHSKMFALPLLSALAASSLAAPHLKKRDSVSGFDISHYQPSVDFEAAYNDGGLRFVYIKATEGTTYEDPMFSVHSPAHTSSTSPR